MLSTEARSADLDVGGREKWQGKCVEMCVSKRERAIETEKVEVAICRIITECAARLNEAEGGDIWWHILGNSVHICSVRVHVPVSAYMRVHTLIHVFAPVIAQRKI